VKSINERIKLIIDQHCKGNVSAFGVEIGATQSTIRSIVKEGGSKPTTQTINKILSATSLNIDPEWLLTGEGSMTKEDPEGGKMIPYFPDINASAGMDFLTNNGHTYSLPIKIPNIDAQAFINVFGDSMYPKYCSGEIIGIKQIEKDMVFPGHAYVIQMIDGEAYIKYIDPGKDEEHWILRSENEKYKPKQIHLSKILKVYIIKAVITKSTLL